MSRRLMSEQKIMSEQKLMSEGRATHLVLSGSGGCGGSGLGVFQARREHRGRTVDGRYVPPRHAHVLLPLLVGQPCQRWVPKTCH